MANQITCSGFDQNGVRRVFGLGYDRGTARERAVDAAFDYLRERPDTGPIAAWSFTYDQPITEIDDGMGGRYRPGVILSI